MAMLTMTIQAEEQPLASQEPVVAEVIDTPTMIQIMQQPTAIISQELAEECHSLPTEEVQEEVLPCQEIAEEAVPVVAENEVVLEVPALEEATAQEEVPAPTMEVAQVEEPAVTDEVSEAKLEDE